MILFEIQTTLPDEQAAAHISGILLAARLVACVNIVTCKSMYYWQSELHMDNECIVYYKTTAHRLIETIDKLKSIHPYSLPAILHWEAHSTTEYAEWVDAQTKAAH